MNNRYTPIKTLTCLRRLIELSSGYRWLLLVNAAIGVSVVVVSLCFIAVSKRLVDIATGAMDGNLRLYACLMLSCMAAQIVLSVLNNWLETRNEVRLRNSLRKRIFVRLMESRWCAGGELHTGDVVNRLEEDTRVVVDALCDNVPSALVSFIQLLAGFSFLLMLEERLAWAVLVIMPIAFLLSKVYMPKMRRLTRDIRTSDGMVQAYVQERLQHRLLISAMERTDDSIDSLSSLQDELSSRVMKRAQFSIFSHSVVQVGFAAGYSLAFLWGIFGLNSGAVTFGMMTAFLQLVAQVQRPVVDLGQKLPFMVHALTSVERIVELLDLPSEDRGDAIKIGGDVGVLFKDVCYTYPGASRKVLDKFSYDFRPSTFTALVGETGAGKSTLMRLMLALIEPGCGSVTLYNGTESVVASPRTRCNLVYVPQGNTLMSGTLRDNLLLGNPNATDDDIAHALHVAVADFVFDLPDGLDSLCGEGGVGLSEGQAQRVAIARGLLRPGSIVLLDEPTSSLDPETERTLLCRLSGEVAHRTVIVVTHRESVVELCEECCTLK